MPRPEAANILIVEDDPGTAALQQRVLTRAGYRVRIANSAAEAADALRAAPAQLILLDNRLSGGVSGIEFLGGLRNLAPGVPVIMVTGAELQGAAISALRGGVRDFIRKDLNYIEDLPRAVANVLDETNLQAQLASAAPSALAALLLEPEGPSAALGIVEGLGFRVFTARDTAEALQRIAAEDIRLLIVDRDAPPSGGIEAFRAVRNAGHDVRGILTSSETGQDLLVEAMRAGFADFVLKTGDYASALSQAVQRTADRLSLEGRLAESHARLTGIVNSAMDAILLVDETRSVAMFNPAAERLFQISAADAIGRPVTAFIPDLAGPLSGPESFSTPAAPRHIDARGVRNGGSEVALEVALAPMHSGGRRFFTVIARDVTQRKELERHLLQKDKLESLGMLAGGIAHDFNNLLVGILGSSSLALETISSSNPARSMIKDVIMASETAANLTRQLLAYAGKGRFIIEPVDLSDLVRQISALLQTSIPKNVQLRLELAENLPCVEADLAQMQQVLMNLVINGAEAIGEQQGTVLITTGVQRVDQDYISSVLVPAQIEPGDYILVQVHDTGCGMSQDTIDRIFDPFFTTKFTGRGLGLAAVLGIVRGHNGAIKVYSTVGQGTTFKLLFPTTGRHADVTQPHILPPQTSKGETVMVVDDEQIVRRSAKAMLERYAYSVVLAENGQEAVDLYRVLADKIDVVLLDMTMPVMGGEEAFRQLKTIRPDIRVILSSGYNEVEAIRRFAGKGLAGFLQKPYNIVTLIDKVRAVLVG